MYVLIRFALLVALGAAVAAAYALGLHQFLSWRALAAHRAALNGFVAAHPGASTLAYVAIYAAAVALSLPGAAVLTVAGGLLFGVVLGAALAVVGATLGAVLLFLVARYVLEGFLAAKAAPLQARIRSGLERDGFRYLLALRLVPLFPFWLVNLAAALAGMRLVPYATATLVGIVPATVVFASAGAGLGDALGRGAPDLSLAYSPRVLLPLLGLAALAVAPAIRRNWARRHA